MYENIGNLIEETDNMPRDQRMPKYLEAIAKLLANLVELQISNKEEVKSET
jgi:hypothetical protein